MAYNLADTVLFLSVAMGLFALVLLVVGLVRVHKHISARSHSVVAQPYKPNDSKGSHGKSFKCEKSLTKESEFKQGDSPVEGLPNKIGAFERASKNFK